jgi:hypothetical protein
MASFMILPMNPVTLFKMKSMLWPESMSHIPGDKDWEELYTMGGLRLQSHQSPDDGDRDRPWNVGQF